jgi:hypothetical protein
VRNNVVTDTGNSPKNAPTGCFCNFGINARWEHTTPSCGFSTAASGDVVGNIVNGITPRAGGGCAIGLAGGVNGVTKGNFVHRASAADSGMEASFCQDNVVTSGARTCVTDIGVNHP